MVGIREREPFEMFAGSFEEKTAKALPFFTIKRIGLPFFAVRRMFSVLQAIESNQTFFSVKKASYSKF